MCHSPGTTTLYEPTTKHCYDMLYTRALCALLNTKLRSLFDLKIFIDADSDMRMERRVSRDISERGRTPEEVVVIVVELSQLPEDEKELFAFNNSPTNTQKAAKVLVILIINLFLLYVLGLDHSFHL